MKISKTAVLVLGVMFSALSLGLILVNAGEVSVYVDPSNAVQHIQEVMFISTGSTKSVKMTSQKNRLTQLETISNFVLSKTGDNELNIVLSGSRNSILGGISNKMSVGSLGYSVILAGSGNIINGRGYDVIVGGEGNTISGAHGTIIGGKNNVMIGGLNAVTGGSSVIVGGSNNMVSGNYSVVAGNNSYVVGNNSVALGSGAKVRADNSFLWTDSKNSDELVESDVFVVDASSGMVVNKNEAHKFAKLTLGGPLSVFSNVGDINIQCGSGKGGGTLKVVNTDTNQMCLCSCDGYNWNSMFAKGRCAGACQDIKPKCGNTVERVCNTGGITYSGSCLWGKSIDEEGSYLVDKNNKVHRSCQTDDGSIEYCSGFVAAGGVEECVWDCKGTLPKNASLNGRQVTRQNDIFYFYDPVSTGDCAYSCNSGFDYVVNHGGKCVKCVEGSYNTGSRTCEELPDCEKPSVPYSGGCITLGNCMNASRQFSISDTKQYYNDSSNWYDKKADYFKPYGAQAEKNWVCKSSSGDVTPHSCEFSCKDGFSCANGWGGPYCRDDNKFYCYGWSEPFTTTERTRRVYTGWGLFYWYHPTTHPTILVSYLDSREDFSDKVATQATGCYSFCDSGYHKATNTTSPEYKAGFCYSNCKSMSLGAANKNGEWINFHDWNDARWYTGRFYNGKFDGRDKSWTYVDSGVLNNVIENESGGVCLWTCKSGIPVEDLKKHSEFTKYFSYGNGRQYNTCWEKCATGYYFSGYLCVKLKTNQYIADNTKVITYSGVSNYAGETLACPSGEKYVNGVCSADYTEMGCKTGYRLIDGKCYGCPQGENFENPTGNECVEMCPENYVYKPDLKSCMDNSSSASCKGGRKVGGKCYICPSGYVFENDTSIQCVSMCPDDFRYDSTNKSCMGNNSSISCEGGRTVGGKCYICPSGYWWNEDGTRCEYYDRCDIDHDGDVDSQDSNLIVQCIVNQSLIGAWCDVNGDGTVDVSDSNLFVPGNECFNKIG